MPAGPVFVLDTHALVWYLEDSAKLSPAARRELSGIEQGDAVGVVPTIVLAELVHLAGKRGTPVDIEETIVRLRESANFVIASLDLMTVLAMIPLTSYEIHDRVIVATTRSLEASLITRDEHIRQSGEVTCVW